MPYIPDQQINTGQFISTTSIFDPSAFYQTEITSPQFKDLLVKLHQQVNNIALSSNSKIAGQYPLEEFVTSALFFNPNNPDPLQLRPEFRKTFNIGPVNAGVTTVAHGLNITNTWHFTKIYGVASNSGPLRFYPLPYPTITLNLDGTNININNTSGLTFDSCIITVQYLKF